MSQPSTHGDIKCKDLIIENEIKFKGSANDADEIVLTCAEPTTGSFTLSIPAITQNQTILHNSSAISSSQISTTLQEVYDNSTDGTITTDSTRQNVILKRGSTADTNVVFEVQNGAGSAIFQVFGNKTVIKPTSVPSTATSGGTLGTITYNTTHLYVCVATNTWRRISLSTW